MSTLADLGSPPITNVIEGYSINALSLEGFGLLQRYFEQSDLISVSAAAAQMPNDQGEKLIQITRHEHRQGIFAYGGRSFDIAIQLPDTLPFLLYVLLKPNHPKLTPAAAKLLINKDNRVAVRQACLEQCGYVFETPKKTTDVASSNIPVTTGPELKIE